MKTRNILLYLVLSIITLGLFQVVWFAYITDDTSYASDNSLSGVLSIIFTILTLGIYKIYWSYVIGKKIALAQKEYGLYEKDNSIMYLFLSLFGVDIVNFCIMQSDLNDIALKAN